MTANGKSSSGWPHESLPTVMEVNPSRISLNLPDNEPIPFVPMAAVTENAGGIDVSTMRPWAEVKKGYTQFQSDDVLFAKITPCMENGKIALVPSLASNVGYGSTEFHVLRPLPRIHSKWILYFLSQTVVRRAAQRAMTGSAGQLRVPTKWFEAQEIPVPPTLKEQQKVISKIEELFSNLEAGQAALERAKANLKRYRASILKAAVEGKLTERWRKENPNVEPASELLKRILTERRRKWETEQLAKFEKSGKQPPTDWKSKYKEPSAPDTSGLPKLPKSWCWVGLCQISDSIKNGSSSPPSTHCSGIPILKINAVRQMSVNFDEYKYTSNNASTDDFIVQENDLFFTRYNGSADLVGVCGRVSFQPPFMMYPDKLIRVRVPNPVLSRYVELASSTGASRQHIQMRSRTTAGQTGVSGQDLKELPIPLPPSSEQAEVAKMVEAQLSVVNHLYSDLAAKQKVSSALRQSILAKAFRGELV